MFLGLRIIIGVAAFCMVIFLIVIALIVVSPQEVSFSCKQQGGVCAQGCLDAESPSQTPTIGCKADEICCVPITKQVQ